MLKIITPLAWLFTIATMVLGAAMLVGDTDLMAYSLPCLAITLALSIVRLRLANGQRGNPTAG